MQSLGSLSSPGSGGSSEEFGASASASGNLSVAVGNTAAATGSSAVALGYNVQNIGSNNTVAIGAGVSLSSGTHQSIVIGVSSSCNNANAVMIGYNLSGAGGTSVSVGSSMTVTSNGHVAMGFGASTGSQNGVIVIGGGATANAAGQIVFASTTYGLSSLWLGNPSATSPTNFSINVSSASGTDVNGASLTINGGRPTGAGTGGQIILQTAPAGATGTTVRGLVTRMTIDQNGAISGSMDTMTYASTITLDVTKPNLHKTTTVNATGNATINASAAGTAGQTIKVLIINDATSGKTITFGTNFKPSGTLVGTASKAAIVTFDSDGINWYESARVTGL